MCRRRLEALEADTLRRSARKARLARVQNDAIKNVMGTEKTITNCRKAIIYILWACSANGGC